MLRIRRENDRGTRTPDSRPVQHRPPIAKLTHYAHVRDLVEEKFKLVKTGKHRERIAQKIADMARTYDDAVRAVAPDAPTYREASELVLAHLRSLLP
jgi:hypothetical protein